MERLQGPISRHIALIGTLLACTFENLHTEQNPQLVAARNAVIRFVREETPWVYMYGPPGSGKTAFATILVAAINAETNENTAALDVVWDDIGRWMELLGPCLPHTDCFIPNLAEAQALLGLETEDPENVARALLSHDVGTVVLKLGVDGCLLMTNTGDAMHFPAFKVNVVDATGAGDAFAAGFIAGVWQGWPLERPGSRTP